MIAFLISSFIVDMNKICEYQSPRGLYVMTIQAQELCPLSVEI